jgi:hypothetical protein
MESITLRTDPDFKAAVLETCTGEDNYMIPTPFAFASIGISGMDRD